MNKILIPLSSLLPNSQNHRFLSRSCFFSPDPRLQTGPLSRAEDLDLASGLPLSYHLISVGQLYQWQRQSLSLIIHYLQVASSDTFVIGFA